MLLGFFLRGLMIGFSIAAPVGPIGVLCIRRTLADGRAVGFASGLGAATADALYGCIAGFGLTFVAGFLIGQQMWLKLVGGIFLFYLGLRTFVAKPATKAAPVAAGGLLSAYASTLILTLTNPLTILSFAAVFAGLGLGSTMEDYGAAAILVLGVFSGSAMWWLLLSGGIGLLRTQIDVAKMMLINRISGIIITVFGIIALVSLSTNL